jgi:hypothetical protein
MSSSSREPDPSSTGGSGPSGFDPAREPFLIWSRKRRLWHRRGDDGAARGYTFDIGQAGRFDSAVALEYGDGVHNDAIPLEDAFAPAVLRHRIAGIVEPMGHNVDPYEIADEILALIAAASAIEAATAAKTAQTGLAEGESAVPKADAQPIEPIRDSAS